MTTAEGSWLIPADEPSEHRLGDLHKLQLSCCLSLSLHACLSEVELSVVALSAPWKAPGILCGEMETFATPTPPTACEGHVPPHPNRETSVYTETCDVTLPRGTPAHRMQGVLQYDRSSCRVDGIINMCLLCQTGSRRRLPNHLWIFILSCEGGLANAS